MHKLSILYGYNKYIPLIKLVYTTYINGIYQTYTKYITSLKRKVSCEHVYAIYQAYTWYKYWSIVYIRYIPGIHHAYTFHMTIYSIYIWILANVRCRTSDVRHRIIPMLHTMSYVRHVRPWHSTHTMSYVVHVRHRISMSYVRHVRHRNIRCRSTYDIATIRCRMFIRYHRSDVRHRMLSSYMTSFVLACISYVHAYNIAHTT